MIYCVWYPSGGYGHFVNAVLSLHGHNFVRPANQLTFSNNGNSHKLDLVVPKYFLQTWVDDFEFDSNKNYSVLVDNGIDDEGEQFRRRFPSAKIIKICYTNQSWPIVAHTMIRKALNNTIEQELAVDPTQWNCQDNWALREKYFLYLRDHKLRSKWQPNDFSTPLYVDNIVNYNNFCDNLELCGVKVEDFESLWQTWYQSNVEYIKPVIQCQQIMHDLVWGQTETYLA